MIPLAEKHIKRFRVETRKLFHHRLRLILWIGTILIPLFSLLDFVVARQHLLLFLLYRLICTTGFLGLLFLYHRRIGYKRPFLLSTLAFIFAGLTISLMIVKLGGFASAYYAGLLLVLVTYSVILPLNLAQSVCSSLLLYAIYTVPLFQFQELTPESLPVFINNNFFFIAFIIITAVQCHDDTRARTREFNLRMALNNQARKLKYYAKHLEDEVEKRALALEESELRYRDLYENIIDMVILVNEQGRVFMANPLFRNTFNIAENALHEFPFISLVHHDYKASVQELLLNKLLQTAVVRDFQFRIIRPDGELMEVECNAKRIEKEEALVGFQLVIRDITKRKELQRSLLKSYEDVYNARMATILGLAKLAEYRDKNTGYHLERIREYCRVLAEELATTPEYQGYITAEYIENLYSSSILHDIGKVAIPDAILLKPAKLSPQEFEIIKQHSIIGGDALKAIEEKTGGESFLTMGKEIAYHHHERWDGTGYPSGLRGEEIPISTRIVALADVYDALTSQRSYKPAYSHELAKEIIIKEKGSHFDPQIVEAFLARELDFNSIRQQLDS